MATSSPRTKVPLSLLELAACELGFALFALQSLYAGIAPRDVVLGSGIAAFCFWWGFQLGTPQTGNNLMQPAFVGTGMALLVESLMVYTGLIAPTTVLSLAGGCVAATLLNKGLRTWLDPRSGDARVVIVGCGAAGSRIAASLGSQLIGVLDATAESTPPGIAYLGPIGDLKSTIAARHPTGLVLDAPGWERYFSPRFLLERKLEGIRIENAATAYERLLERISVEVYRPFHFWQETLRSNRRIMAFQAIYSNLAGLILLVAFSPLLVVIGLAARFAAGPGPVFERVSCRGFQRIPFVRRRFRIRSASTGEKTGIGKLISALRLTNLPQMINLVRGEMGLFGPEPIRAEFAEYLEELSPVYSFRFSMKPGIFGWAQANSSRGGVLQEENTRLGYDLYYLEYGSPLVDLEILARTMVRKR